jgi:hypothetical protein
MSGCPLLREELRKKADGFRSIALMLTEPVFQLRLICSRRHDDESVFLARSMAR